METAKVLKHPKANQVLDRHRLADFVASQGIVNPVILGQRADTFEFVLLCQDGLSTEKASTLLKLGEFYVFGVARK